MQLRENNYIWAVTYISRDDGHRVTAAYFTQRKTAEEFCQSRAYGDQQTVVQTSLMQDMSSGRFFEVKTREVKVDEQVHRESALKKLTPQERDALSV